MSFHNSLLKFWTQQEMCPSSAPQNHFAEDSADGPAATVTT